MWLLESLSDNVVQLVKGTGWAIAFRYSCHDYFWCIDTPSVAIQRLKSVFGNLKLLIGMLKYNMAAEINFYKRFQCPFQAILDDLKDPAVEIKSFVSIKIIAVKMWMLAEFYMLQVILILNHHSSTLPPSLCFCFQVWLYLNSNLNRIRINSEFQHPLQP